MLTAIGGAVRSQPCSRAQLGSRAAVRPTRGYSDRAAVACAASRGRMNPVDETKTAAEVPARCLDDSTVLRFVSGQLDETERRSVEHEIGRCRHCSALVAELIRGSSALHVDAEHLDGPDAAGVGADGAVYAEGTNRSDW